MCPASHTEVEMDKMSEFTVLGGDSGGSHNALVLLAWTSLKNIASLPICTQKNAKRSQLYTTAIICQLKRVDNNPL